jgi:hypothetical protein
MFAEIWSHSIAKRFWMADASSVLRIILARTLKMKSRFALGFIAFVAVSGCSVMSAPQSADGLRAAVNNGSFLTEQTTQKVSRSYSAVVASVRAGAKKCMNRSVSQTFTSSPGPGFAPVRNTINMYYKTDVTSKGSFTEVAMQKRMGNGGTDMFGNKREGFAYVADIHPASGGTELKFYGGKFGYGPINTAIAQWARGGAIRCPELP